MPVPIAPLAEQRRLVAKVNQLMTLVDQLETQLVASRAAGFKLLDAVIAELTAVAAQIQPRTGRHESALAGV
jgi:type I restriction enzyme S subunit